MKSFKTLPNKLEDRIEALTPKTILGIKTKIHIIKNNVLDTENFSDSSAYRISYANILCKIKNRINSFPFIMRVSRLCVDSALDQVGKSKKTIFVYDSAKENGWTDADINYDAIIQSLLVRSVHECTYNGRPCPELRYAVTHVTIVVSDFYENQHVGWYFYNTNLDEPLFYTGFKL
jgi:hypothetical protein